MRIQTKLSKRAIIILCVVLVILSVASIDYYNSHKKYKAAIQRIDDEHERRIKELEKVSRSYDRIGNSNAESEAEYSISKKK